MTCLADKHLIPREMKKTTKYTETDRINVRLYYKHGMSINAISREIPMSKRMVQFILFPERAALAKKNYAKRQKTGIYRYPTAIQSAMVQKVRQRKRAILPKLLLK